MSIKMHPGLIDGLQACRPRGLWRACQAFVLAALVGLAVVAGLIVPSRAEQFEAPVNRKAAETIPAELLRGPNYSVRQTVVSYGYMNQWTLDSDFGTFKAVGEGALRARIREIYAIAELEKISRSEAFKDSVVYAAKQPFEFAGKSSARRRISDLREHLHRSC
jgi:hypothetical protein